MNGKTARVVRKYANIIAPGNKWVLKNIKALWYGSSDRDKSSLRTTMKTVIQREKSISHMKDYFSTKTVTRCQTDDEDSNGQ